MSVLKALTFLYAILTTVRAFATRRSVQYDRSIGTTLSAGLFDNIFKSKEQGKVEKSIGTVGNANSSVKKQLDIMVKKKKFSVLIVSSSSQDFINEKRLLDEKSVKYKAIELDKEANAKAIREEFGIGIWIRGKFIAGFNELNSLDKKGELDGLLKNVPKTTYTTPR